MATCEMSSGMEMSLDWTKAERGGIARPRAVAHGPTPTDHTPGPGPGTRGGRPWPCATLQGNQAGTAVAINHINGGGTEVSIVRAPERNSKVRLIATYLDTFSSQCVKSSPFSYSAMPHAFLLHLGVR